MNSVTEKGYAKINLGLDVTGRRPNGYHDLRMIMQTIGLYDTVTIQRTEEDGIILTTDNPTLPCDESNLIYKAAVLMRDTYSLTDGVRIRLEKRIPVAAGLAGGSTDAACVFRGMSRLFDLQLSEDELRKISLLIGADVPYCISGGTFLAEGIGEILTPLSDLPEIPLVLIKPGFDVSTKYVYENLHANELKEHPDITSQCEAIEKEDLGRMAKLMGNVLEKVTVTKYPEIEEIKNDFISLGSYGAMMSGSGPSVFGLFQTREDAEKAFLSMKEKYSSAQVFLTETKKADYQF